MRYKKTRRDRFEKSEKKWKKKKNKQDDDLSIRHAKTEKKRNPRGASEVDWIFRENLGRGRDAEWSWRPSARPPFTTTGRGRIPAPVGRL